jgi:hypothetical protein
MMEPLPQVVNLYNLFSKLLMPAVSFSKLSEAHHF